MLAVPLHGEEVAPRFCSADRFLIAELDRGELHRMRELSLAEETWSQRLESLSTAGVKTLLCGGFNRDFLPLAEGLGIRVVSGLAGEARPLIDAFLRDEIERFQFLPCLRGRSGPGRAGCGRRSSERAFREPRGRKGGAPCRDTTEPGLWKPDRARDGTGADAADRPPAPQR